MLCSFFFIFVGKKGDHSLAAWLPPSFELLHPGLPVATDVENNVCSCDTKGCAVATEL
jgi:hypothetical protein